MNERGMSPLLLFFSSLTPSTLAILSNYPFGFSSSCPTSIAALQSLLFLVSPVQLFTIVFTNFASSECQLSIIMF